MIGERWLVLGVGLMLFGAGLLVLTARRARRAKRVRVAQRREVYRQGSVWPGPEPMPPMRAGVYRGAPVRDVDATAVMARVRGGELRG